MTARAPSRISTGMVRLAARTLPCVHRDRYAGEFTAELYGMARPAQLRHATQVLVQAWALRTALTNAPTTIGAEAMTPVRSVPLTCRLNLRHKWRLASTEDGGNRYWSCALCGKDRGQGPSQTFVAGGL